MILETLKKNEFVVIGELLFALCVERFDAIDVCAQFGKQAKVQSFFNALTQP